MTEDSNMGLEFTMKMGILYTFPHRNWSIKEVRI
jgi:hypothetical protein